MRYATALFLSAAAAFAQGGIVGTASRTASVPPDEGDFTVSVTTTLDTTLAQVIQVFQNAGIRNLTAIELGAASNGISPPLTSVASYQVTFTVQPPALATFTRTLDTMKANPPAGFQSVQYSAALAASAAAVESVRQSILPQLVTEARAKAQALASVAGLKLGRIQSITDSGAASGPFLASRVAAFVIFDPVTGGPFSGNTGIQQTFSVSVIFAAAGQ